MALDRWDNNKFAGSGIPRAEKPDHRHALALLRPRRQRMFNVGTGTVQRIGRIAMTRIPVVVSPSSASGQWFRH
jgi:hypothetical protein